MNLLVAVLLAMPAANPLGPFDGHWTILSVEANGKKTETYVPVTIRDSRLALNELKGEAPLTLELASNHEAWLWAGKSKTVMVPADEYWRRTTVEGGDGPLEKVVVTPAHVVTVAERGFYIESAGLLHVFFVGSDSGRNLTLTLRRDSSVGRANGRPGR